ncbi:MAG: cyclic nucleotide-binding domain-containing protein [Rhodothermales bacterium]|nr:cyclic nucleotide-binding domain-containing protein [Rhodothermales bacterium]
MADAPATPPEGTRLKRQKLFEDRWSAFGEQSGLANLSEMLTPAQLREIDLFSEFDDDLLEEISQDVAVGTWKGGVTLFEEGSYLDLAFYIMSGHVDIFLRKHSDDGPQPIFDANRTTFGAPPPDAAGAGDGASGTATVLAAPPPGADAGRGGTPPDRPITFLASMDFNIPQGGRKHLKTGDLFGEIGALNGWPQSATAQTVSECRLVHIRLPALRKMKSSSDAFKDKVDAIYRERELLAQLKSSPLLRGLEKDFIEELSGRVDLISLSSGDPLTTQGEDVDALYMVRSGFLRVAERIEEADVTVSYLSKGMTIGSVELLLPEQNAWRHSTSAVGYAELVRIDRSDFDGIVSRYPDVEKRLWEGAVAHIRDTGHTRRNLDNSELIEFALQKGLVQGNSILVMDLDVCTRCDDCVRGCSDTHGGRPRFVREGDKYENFLIARSCYHCEDPVCLIGCPTGAIHRTQVEEVVSIDDNLCIGCTNCARKCPYDAIVMHETGEEWPDDMVPSHLRGRPKKVASKCDLCHTAEDGPACVNNCPHSCAFRIGSLEEFEALLANGRIPARS